MFDFDVAVIIPMAGRSERFPFSCPKQYLKCLGKPLFMLCVEEFYNFPYIKKICLVTDKVEFVKNVIKENFNEQEKIIVTEGGNSRHSSIKNGLAELLKFGIYYKIVVIHDGVRPTVPEQLLINIILEAETHGASGATRPLVSTVVKPNREKFLDVSLERSSYLLSETPQAFSLHLITNAYKECSEDDLIQGTECLQLVLKYCGVRAKLIPGPDSLWKVTDKKDFYSISPYLREVSTRVCLLAQEYSNVIQGLKDFLSCRVNHIDYYKHQAEIVLPQKLYNTVVYVHDKEIDQENPTLGLESILDINHQGLILHIIKHSNSDAMKSTTISGIYKTGKLMARHYKKLKKGVVVIYCLSKEEERLIDLLKTLIFNTDPQAISGQILFL